MTGLTTEWLLNNWFTILQSLGIILGLIFTATSIRQATASRRASDLLTLSERHQNLWSELYRRPELHRIWEREVDLVSSPPSVAEQDFLKLVFTHFYTGWLLARTGALLPMKALKEDVRNFFLLPVVRSVWADAREGRDPEFVRFVDSNAKASRTTSSRR
jgi:hypothetical protein